MYVENGSDTLGRALKSYGGSARAICKLALSERESVEPARRFRAHLRATMALDYLGQRICCGCMARRFGPVLMVRGEFRQLQQDLWLARRDHRLHDVDLDLDHRRSGRRQAQCGDGTSDSPREHHRATKAARETRGENGRYGRGGTGVTYEANPAPLQPSAWLSIHLLFRIGRNAGIKITQAATSEPRRSSADFSLL